MARAAKRQTKNAGTGAAAPRVVHLTTVHHPQDPRIFYKELTTLREAGYEPFLIAQHPRSERVDGIRIEGLSSAEGYLGRLQLQPLVWRKARALRADVYHFHDPELIPLVYALKRATGARVIYDMHENYRGHGAVLGRAIRALERWCFSWVDHVVLAETAYAPIVASYDVPRTLIANYYKAPEAAESPEVPSGPNASEGLGPPRRLLYTGTVGGTRGLFSMLELGLRIRQAQRKETLDVVGICRRPSERRRAERFIQTHALDDVVTRVGWHRYVPATAMDPYYRSADVGLALFEPHPNHICSLLTKFYEYLHYGLPIICSDFPLWRCFVERHECGAVVPPGDVDAVLSVLDHWQADPGSYRRAVRNARAAAPAYRWEVMGARLVRIYRELLGEDAASNAPASVLSE